MTHGGKAPQVRAKAEERLAEMVDPALVRLRHLIDNADSDAVKLAAVKDALDRAGYRPIEKRENKNTTDLRLREVPDDVLRQLVDEAPE